MTKPLKIKKKYKSTETSSNDCNKQQENTAMKQQEK